VVRILAVMSLTVLLCAPAARAQTTPSAASAADADTDAAPVTGAHEFQIWTGAGHGLNGSTSGTTVWNAGARYGWVLTEPHGPGFLRGRFEYAVDVVPVFVFFQPGGAAYGAGVDPFALKWIFATRGSVRPYTDLGGGVVFTNHEVPRGAAPINFTTSSAFGLQFLRHKYNWSAEIRFMHISDASLTKYNPGDNTLQVRIGFGFFTHPK
jgi:hypothetical protein